MKEPKNPAKPAPTSKPPVDPLTILTPGELAILRKGYDGNDILALAPLLVPYPKASGLVQWISATVYGYQPNPKTPPDPKTSLAAHEREMLIVALAALKGDPFTMSGHVYWALMEDLKAGNANPVERLCDALITLGAYGGVDTLRWADAVLGEVLAVLKTAAESPATALTKAVLEALGDVFPRW